MRTAVIAVAPGEDLRAAVERAGAADAIVLHDADAPLGDVQPLLDALAGCDAVVAGAPVTDTIKRAAPDGRIVETLHRGELWHLGMPQAYRAEALRAALTRGPLPESVRGAVRVVELQG